MTFCSSGTNFLVLIYVKSSVISSSVVMGCGWVHGQNIKAAQNRLKHILVLEFFEIR